MVNTDTKSVMRRKNDKSLQYFISLFQVLYVLFLPFFAGFNTVVPFTGFVAVVNDLSWLSWLLLSDKALIMLLM